MATTIANLARILGGRVNGAFPSPERNPERITFAFEHGITLSVLAATMGCDDESGGAVLETILERSPIVYGTPVEMSKVFDALAELQAKAPDVSADVEYIVKILSRAYENMLKKETEQRRNNDRY